MIYCPECGTANRDGSKFCNECGHQLLAQTGVKCPHCDTLNTVQSVFCSGCGGRLLAQPSPAPSAVTPPIKGLSLPTKPTVGESEEIEQSSAEGLEGALARSSRLEGAGKPMAEEGEELPDWLRDLQASLPIEPEPEPIPTPPQPTTISKASQPEAGELPSWLAELKTTAEVETPKAPAVEAELVEEELPPWLAELKPAVEAETPKAPAVEAELVEEELPPWLAELKPAAEAETPKAPHVEAELVEEELPPWLAGLEPPAEALPQKAQAIEAGATEKELPSWLAEPQPSASAKAPFEAPEAELEEGKLPDWLVPAPEPGITGEEETLARAEIPDWLLALKPRELKTEGETAGVETVVEEAMEQTGVLAGIRDVLPVEMLIAQPRAVTAQVVGTPFTGEAALVQAARVRLFDEIVTRSPVAMPKVLAKPKARLIDLLPWWIVYAILILAVTAPLLLGKPLFDRNIEPAPSAKTLYEAVDSLPANAQVLVAVDYDPTTSGEMDIVAQSLVSHLMERQVRIVAVSLLPAGPATAETLVKEGSDSHPSSYQTGDGRQYVNLGYLPGQASAVRLLGQSLPDALPRDFEGREVTALAALSGITSTQSFDLIVELAAASDTLRWWIEQAGAPYDVPLVAGVSAAVEPVARTYYETESQQLKGVIGGIPGAASYESLGSGGAGPSPEMAARLDSLLVGQVLIILVILGGNLIRPRGRAPRGEGREQ